MKFLADSMLGKLARWLRMMGNDVIYDTRLNDEQLLDLAEKETRVLLTSDLELYKRASTRNIAAFFVEGKSESDRIAEVANRYDLILAIEMERSNCPICNTKLIETPKEHLFGQLQKNTLAYYNKFWKCPNCSQVYWQGSHWKQITNTLSEAQAKLEKSKEKVEA